MEYAQLFQMTMAGDFKTVRELLAYHTYTREQYEFCLLEVATLCLLPTLPRRTDYLQTQQELYDSYTTNYTTTGILTPSGFYVPTNSY